MIEGLAGIPRQAFRLGRCLQVAAGEVQADAVAEDEFVRIGRIDRARRRIAAERHHQFDFVVQVAGAGRIGHLAHR